MGFKTRLKDNISNLVFCYKNGGLVHSIGLKSNVANSNDFEREMIKFYSMKMLIIHCLLLKDDGDGTERIKKIFLKSHSYESLEAFVMRDKKKEIVDNKMMFQKAIKKLKKIFKENEIKSLDIDEENDSKKVKGFKKQMKELQTKMNKSNINRSIVLTHSQTKKRNFSELNEINYGINEINQNGITALEEALISFLSPKHRSQLFVIEINDSEKVDLVEYLKNVVDNSIENFYSKDLTSKKTLKNKEILIIYFKPLMFEINKDTNLYDIEYFDDNWNYQVIDDLQNSSYQQNMLYISETSQDIYTRLRTGNCSDLLTKMFMDSIKDMEVRATSRCISRTRSCRLCISRLS